MYIVMSFSWPVRNISILLFCLSFTVFNVVSQSSIFLIYVLSCDWFVKYLYRSLFVYLLRTCFFLLNEGSANKLFKL